MFFFDYADKLVRIENGPYNYQFSHQLEIKGGEKIEPGMSRRKKWLIVNRVLIFLLMSGTEARKTLQE